MKPTSPLASAALLALIATAAPAGHLENFPLLHDAAGVPAAAYPGEEVLREDFLRPTLEFLAHDDKKGRKPGSPQLETVVFDFMIEKLTAWGLTPAGDAAGTSFKQPFKASSWWPIRGLAEPAELPHVDRELFCAVANEHGFAAKPDGTPVSVDAAELLERGGLELAAAGSRAKISRASYNTHNIVAMVPGADPALADEVVVLGAHIDHIGHRGDTIYNGADDNGSGSTILLNIAKAFAAEAAAGRGPKRSMLFIWFSAEEMGLLGSQYWVKNPTIDLARVKTMINMDMLGRTESDEISVYDGLSHDQGWVFHDWHDTDSLGFHDVQHNLKNFLRRSDQFPFYQKGIPVMFFFEGFRGQSGQAMNHDYHRPTDTVEKIDFSKLRRAAGFIYRHAYRASRDTLPAMHDGV